MAPGVMFARSLLVLFLTHLGILWWVVLVASHPAPHTPMATGLTPHHEQEEQAEDYPYTVTLQKLTHIGFPLLFPNLILKRPS